MIIYISSFYPSNAEKFRGHYIEKQAKLLSEIINEDLIIFKPIFSLRNLKPKVTYEVVNSIPVYSFYFPNILKKHSIFYTTKVAINFFKKEIQKIIANRNVKLVVSNNLDVTLKFGNILSDVYKSKHFTVIHGETITTNTSSHIKKNIIKELTKTDCIFAVSTIIKEYLNNIVGYRGKIVINPNGINTQLIKKYSSTKVRKNKILTITSVGNLQYNKGFDIVLKALQHVNIPYEYNIVGDGDYKDALMKQVDAFGMKNKVNFTGNISNEEVYNMLEKSHFFILPSRREAFGIVYLEGMITCNICVGTEGQGPKDFINNGENGFLVSNSDEIKDIILNYSSIKDSEIIQNGFRTAKMYTWEKNVNKLINFY